GGVAAGASLAAGAAALALAWIARQGRRPAAGDGAGLLDRAYRADEAAMTMGRWTASVGRELWTFVDSLLLDTVVAGGLSLVVRGAGWALGWIGDGSRRGSAWLAIVALLGALAAALAALG
ncbi:MAG: hypothetical protein ABIL09_15315, partial [Gemmatimonadota bacterium]